MKFRWSPAPPQPLLAAPLASALRIPPLLAQCLLNRGLGDPAAVAGFLQPRLKQLANPFLLPNMAAAVERLLQARQRSEPLVIFGDYDVDGVTSTALLLEVLRPLGWKVNYYLPHRMDEGYGLSQDGVENCLAKFPVTLLLAVDCGTTSVREIAALCRRLEIPPLSAYGVRREDIPDLVQKAAQSSSMKGNPILLSRSELREIVERCL